MVPRPRHGAIECHGRVEWNPSNQGELRAKMGQTSRHGDCNALSERKENEKAYVEPYRLEWRGVITV